jgi:hypothetical protein
MIKKIIILSILLLFVSCGSTDNKKEVDDISNKIEKSKKA